MPRLPSPLLLLAGLACAESTVPSEGDRWDLLVVRHRMYDCDPDALSVPFPSSPDAAICGSDSGLVSRSRDTLRAQMTLDGLADFNDFNQTPTDTTWTATAIYEIQACTVRPAPGGCEIVSDTTAGFVTRRHRVCHSPPRFYDPPICDGRTGEPVVLLGAGLLFTDTIVVSSIGRSTEEAEGGDVVWDPLGSSGRVSDTLRFRLNRASR